jgi:diguanylate cyclase (GGDEF)-like protein
MDRPQEYELKIPIEIEQYERKIYDLKQLIEISKGLNSTLEYNTLIDSILLTCMGQMQLLRAGIFLKMGIDSDKYTLHRNYKGFDIDHSKEYEISHNSPLIQHIGQNYRCYEVEDFKGRFKNDPSLKVFKMLEPQLIVPLRGKGSLNGIIILGERITGMPFLEHEKEYLLNIASLAGIAIQNAYLYEMATTDMMTKLKVHHYFQTVLLEEFEKSTKFDKPLSMIMCDIDHFKNFNDTWGHSAGDAVLINVARIIKESVRQIDTAARYGGEEFSVILPKTEITEALIVAERIRESVMKEKVMYENNELSVTISVGVAQLDTDNDKSKQDLIERADQALYISKRNGRNQVSFL